MNFIPPARFSDGAPPVKYVPKESKPTEASSSPRVKKKTSLGSLWGRNGPVEGPPPVPESPAAFATPKFRTNGTAISSPANEAPLLDRANDTNSTVPEGPIVNGRSFMDLSNSDGESDEVGRPALLHRLRRVLSKTELTARDGYSPSASASNPSLASRVPSSPAVDSPRFRARLHRPTDAGGTTAQHTPTFTNGSSADLTSLRSVNSSKSSKSRSSSRARHDLGSKLPENPPLDPDFAFDEFITSHRPRPTRSPRMEGEGRPGRTAPPIDSPRSYKYETVSVQSTRESIDGYASFLSQPKTRGLPMPDMIDKDEGEWNRAVDWVRGQEAQRIAREAKAAKVDDKKLRSEEAQRTQKERDMQIKIGLARQFIRRTSTSWAPRHNPNELRADETHHVAIAEALVLASEHENSDPGFTELRKRFFAGISNQSSRSHDEEIPKSAPLPCPQEWSSPPASGSAYSFSRAQQFERSSMSTEQTYATCPVSPAGSGRLGPQSSPSLRSQATTNENAYDGLGIHMKTSDPETRTVILGGSGSSMLAVPASPGYSLPSQRNAFSPGQAVSFYTPQQSPQSRSSDSSPHPSFSTATDDAESRDRLQASASATLANTRIFNVDRDSKIQDRYVPKRGSHLNHTLDAARELAEARMGIPTGPLPPLPQPRKDSVLDSFPTPINKVQSDSAGQNMFKKTAKRPALRAMVSSLSMLPPDATEMVQSPVTPTIAIHPALRSMSSSPITPTAKGHRQTLAQMFTGRTKTPRSSATSSDLASTALNTAVAKSPSQKSLESVAPSEDRWAQRVRQKSKVEQAWKESGILNAPVQQPPLHATSSLASTAHLAHSDRTGLSGFSQTSSVKTPPSPVSFPSIPTATSISSPTPSIGRKLPLPLKLPLPPSRKIPDSPTPLNIRKVTPSPKVQHELSLPGSPASLQLPRLRGHPALRRVPEQGLKDAPDPPNLASAHENNKDPFAKSGSTDKGGNDWPLTDSSTINCDDQQSFERTPLEGQFDSIITSWRHASATREPLYSDASPVEHADDAGKQHYIRDYLGLDELHPPAGKEHPNHPYHWDSMNLMCKDIHNTAQISSETIPPGTRDASVRFCAFCRETCCYFGQQIGRIDLQAMGRDQALEHLKNEARSHVFFLRGACPTGIEDYQALMECDLCDRTCCPGCTNICQYPFCTRPVCKDCVEVDGGVCGIAH